MKSFIFLCCFTAFSFTTKSGFSQNSKIAIENDKTVSIVEVFELIKKQTDYSFIYRSDLFDNASPINIKKGITTVKKLLKISLSKGDFVYEFTKDDSIILKKKADTQKAIIQQRVSGKITDENGNTLPGATVIEKGTKNGTVSDFAGGYTFNISNSNATLVFEYIGFVTQEILVDGKTTIDVTLKTDVTELEGVVISTGYQKIKRERVTGSIETITSASVTNTGTTSIDRLLEGQVVGLTSVSSGRPGEDATITIRGINSLTGDTSPLWIVDGMPLMGNVPQVRDGNELQAQVLTSGIGNISPEDIATISVLRDAAATAIYGARAANGVIVVTTKSGHVGRTFFNVTSNYEITERPKNNLPMMNSAQKVEFERGFYDDFNSARYRGRAFEIQRDLILDNMTPSESETLFNNLRNTNTDWFKEVFSSGQSSQHSISMSGGTEETQYYASVNLLNEDGIIPNNKYNRFGVNFKLIHNPSDKIQITFGMSSSVRKNRESASMINPLFYAIYANPYEKPYNEDGSYAYDHSYNFGTSQFSENGWKSDYYDRFNILEDLNSNTSESKYMSIVSNLMFEYEILPGLTFTSQGAYNINSEHGSIIQGANTYTNYIQNWNPLISYSEFGDIEYDLIDGSLRESTSNGNDYNFRNTLQYTTEFNDKHFINLFAGQEVRKTVSNSSYNYSPVFDEVHRVVGFPDLSEFEEADLLNLRALGGTGQYESRLSSFFLNTLYSYKDKYIASGSIRYDGSDVIGNKNQFTPLWNVSTRWNLHREDFISKVPFINQLSLKAGYGFTGSIDRNALPFVKMIYGSSTLYDGSSIPSDVEFPNTHIKWQTKEDISLGFETTLFNNRLELEINYFNNTTKDVLDNKKLPISSGRQSVKENVATIANKGWEFNLSTTNVRTKDFTWVTRFNVAFLDNEVLKSFNKSLDDLSITERRQFVEGYPVGGWYGFNFEGINPGDGHVYIAQNGENFDLDLFRNSTLNIPVPKVSYLGDFNPNIVGGVSSTFRYKQLSLIVSGEFKAGHKILSFGANDDRVNSRNKPAYLNDRWVQSGDITDIAPISQVQTQYDRYMFDRKLEDGDYFRINFVSLGYNFKNDIISKLGLNNARLNLNIRNLYSFTKYRGIDPSLLGSMGYPNTPKYSFSLNVGF